MRIGIDAALVVPQRMGGLTTYVVELLHALLALDPDDEFVLFAAPELDRARLFAPNLRCVEAPACGDRPLRRIELLHCWLPERVRALGIDVLHHTANLACIPRGFRSVLTLHDLIPLHYLNGEGNPARPFFSHWLRVASARLAHEVIAVSATMARAIRALPAVAAPVEAIPLAPRPFAEPAASPSSSGHLLVVGSSSHHKNLPRLLRSYLATRVGRPLLVAGTDGWTGNSAAVEIRALTERSAGRIRLLGHVSEAALGELYRTARALVFPSLAEGFGLPPLEAASLGTPVALSDLEVHREVMGDAALRFDPHREDSIARAISRLHADDALCRKLSALGRARAAEFTWQTVAAKTLQVYRRAA